MVELTPVSVRAAVPVMLSVPTCVATAAIEPVALASPVAVAVPRIAVELMPIARTVTAGTTVPMCVVLEIPVRLTFAVPLTVTAPMCDVDEIPVRLTFTPEKNVTIWQLQNGVPLFPVPNVAVAS